MCCGKILSRLIYCKVDIIPNDEDCEPFLLIGGLWSVVSHLLSDYLSFFFDVFANWYSVRASWVMDYRDLDL